MQYEITHMHAKTDIIYVMFYFRIWDVYFDIKERPLWFCPTKLQNMYSSF